jgi:COP9 signalosome complex subunit 5
MVQYLESLKEVGRNENIVGWYHSHPGYGCWLSGIDVGTQHQNQQFQDPFLAVVVDPNRTISAGRVDIGAFRTYPENYRPGRGEGETEYVPLEKVEDFGVHSERYYSLDVSYFRSSLDTQLLQVLWDKYWTSVLGQSALVTNHDYTTRQISEVATRLGAVLHKAGTEFLSRDDGRRKTDAERVVAESVKVGSQQLQGLVSRKIKDRLFAPMS